MADPKIAIAETLKTERGFSNDSRDSGGMTWRGVSRNNFPHLSLWKTIDESLKTVGVEWTVDCSRETRRLIDEVLSKITELETEVGSFYKREFWDPLDLDAEPDQEVANKVFDVAVNMGVRAAREFFNKAKEKL